MSNYISTNDFNIIHYKLKKNLIKLQYKHITQTNEDDLKFRG